MTTPHAQLRERWMNVGRSDERDSRAAGEQAARAAVTGPDPKLLVVFAAIDHDTDAVQAGVREVASGVPVIGCTTHGEIGQGGPRDGSVIVAALGGAGFSVATTLVQEVSGRQRAAGAELAKCVGGVDDRPHKVLLLLSDGMIRDQESVLRGCYQVLGASVPLFGGAAADGWRMTGTYVMSDGHTFDDAIVGAAIASDAPLCVAVQHGWRKVGQPMIVTHTGNGRVYELDDRPALDVYLERLGAPAEAHHDPAAFSLFALPRPLGVQRRSGIEARNLSTEVDLADRSIGGGASIDHGGLVWAMEGDPDSILTATDTACREAIAGLGDHPLVGMLTFSCAALRAILGPEGIQREGAILAKHAEPAPFAGYYTYGEIARIRGIDGFHNQTFTVLAIG